MGLSIVIPCYNEATRDGVSLEDRVRILMEYLNSFIDDFELILVSDGSTDGTADIIIKLSQEFSRYIVPVVYYNNKGKGYAIKEGVLQASKDYILIMDADLATNIKSIQYFYELFKNRDTDCIIGIRDRGYTSARRSLLSQLSHFCMTHLLGLSVKDTQCGFKMVKSSILKLFCSNYQTCNNWLFDAELLVFLKENGYLVRSEVVEWKNSDDSRVTILGGTLSSCIELLRILRLKQHYKVVFQDRVKL